MKILYALLFTFLLSGFNANAQLHPLNEGSVELLGHSLGFGVSYRRTLDVTYRNEWHGLLSTGVTNGMFSSYAGLGYRRGTDYYVEFEALGGFNQLFGLRKEKDDPTRIQSGFSFGVHVNWGLFTYDDYSIRLTTGYHLFQSNYHQPIISMQVGRFF